MEPEEVHPVVAHDEVGVQRDLVARRRDVAQRLRRHREPVTHAAAEHDHVIRAPNGDLALDERDHDAASAVASGARLRWQMATASASAAWSGRGTSVSARSAWTICATWS